MPSESKFFVPIDYSDVREVIPPGEDIIYSTLFKVFSHGGSDPFAITSQSYTSHALFTKKGIAYQKPKQRILKPYYMPWYEVSLIAVSSMLVQDGLTMYTYMLDRHSDYESPQNFEMRAMKFFLEFAPHAIIQKKQSGHTKGLKKFEKSYNKLIKQLGEELVEFLKTNEDYEAFKKIKEQKMQEFWETGPKWARFLVKRFT